MPRVAFILLCFAAVLPARAASDPVVLQMPYADQFQYAGIYAAQAQGFFAGHGLDVRLRPAGQMTTGSIAEVLEGRAQYGVTLGPRLLVERLHGADVVVVAAIMQHSPMVLLARASDGLLSPRDLIGRRVALAGLASISEIRIMLEREGVPLSAITVVPNRAGVNALALGTADAMSSFESDQPAVYAREGLRYNEIRPIDYGVDYYGDCLFTSGQELRQHPAQVAAMRAAILEGWDFALRNPGQMVDWILQHRTSRMPGMDRNALEFEAVQIAKLVNADLVSVGHMNPARWRSMADDIARFDSGVNRARLDGFLYEPGPVQNPWLWWLCGGLAAAALAAGATTLANRRLKRLVVERSRQLLEIEREKRETIQTISDNLPDSVVYQVELEPDGQRRFRYISEAVVRLCGVTPEAVLKDPGVMYGLILEEDLPALRIAEAKAIANGSHFDHTLRMRRKDGEVRWLRLSSSPRKLPDGRMLWDGIQTDVTASRLMDEHLRQAQKMDAIGRLSSGVAHDFNNLLTVITGNVGLLESSESLTAAQVESIGEIKEAADRAAALTRQLLALSRQQAMQPRALNLNEVVDHMGKMLRRLFGENIAMQVNFSPKELWVHADAAMLEQILLNLAVNARDAMPGGGRLVIETALVDIDAAGAAQTVEGRAGTFVTLAVSDTGTGIAPEIISRIFEPFFTTKEQGKGTGLGLSTVYGIAKQHQGWVNVYSEPGRGTTFRVYLPAREAASAGHDSDAPPMEVRAHGETILLVEDEPAVRKLARSVLQNLGYRVIEANSGKLALGTWAERNGPVHLLLTDMVMPDGISGLDLARLLRAEEPALKVVFMSGYSALLASGNLPAGEAFLPKPFDRLSLARILRATLDGTAARTQA